VKAASGSAASALVLVFAFHLLTTAGIWYNTDHGEMLYISARILDHHTIDLWDPGEPHPKFLSWRVTEGQPLPSRFLPTTSFTLLPLLALDRALGLGEPDQFGRLVHLQGHLFVLLSLALLAYALGSLGASPLARAVAVVLTGLSWPVWLVALRLGPEPILVFLVALFLAAEVARGLGKRWGAAAQGLACFALPWVHATGPVVSACLALGVALDHGSDRRRALREALPAAIGCLLGTATFLFFWNHLYEGDWLRGGYARYASEAFALQNPIHGFGIGVASLAWGAPLLLGVGVLALVRAPGPGPGRGTALVLTLGLLLLVAPFARGEATRRLACVLSPWGLVVGARFDRLRLPAGLAEALMALAFAPGLLGLFREGGGFLETSSGIYFVPYLLWVRLWNQGHVVAAFLPPALLLVLLLASLFRVLALAREGRSASP
jgi:hypothetical protein